MGGETLDKMISRLEKYVYNLEAVRGRNKLNSAQRHTVGDLTKYMSLARGQVIFSLGDEDEEARAKGFALADEQLALVIENLLTASSDDLVSIIEVTQLSALAEICRDRIKEL